MACVASGLTGVMWSAHGQPLPRTVAAILLFDGGLNVAAGLAVQGICARMRRDTACLDCFYRYFKQQFDQ